MVQAGRRQRRRRRAVVRGVDGQGRHRGPVAGGRHADRDPRAGGRDRRGRHGDRRRRRRRRRAGRRPGSGGRGGAGRRREPEAPAGAEAKPRPEPAPAVEEPAPEPEPEPAPATDAAPSTKGLLLSPVVRRLVNEHGLDPSAINGSGPGGRITRDDVLDHIDKAGAKPARAAGAQPAAAGRHRQRSAAASGQGRAGRARRAGSCTGGHPGRTGAGRGGGGARHHRQAVEDPQAHRPAHDHEQVGQPARVQRGRGRLRQRRHDTFGGQERVQVVGGLQPHLPAVHQPGRDRRARRVPAPQRQRRRERPRRAPLRRPRHRRRPRLRGTDRPGHPRSRHEAAAGDRSRDLRPRPAGAHEEAEARRDQRRHVHDLQQRLGRIGADDAGHQPAAGGDPLHRRDRAQAGRRIDAATAARRSPSTRSATWRWRGTTARSTAPTPPGS